MVAHGREGGLERQTSSPENGVILISVRGELDIMTAARMTEAINGGLDAAEMALVVDLSGLNFLASAGMTVLVR